MKNNIVLIGMMGCGKTTTGEELAKILPEHIYIDIDKEIEKSTQQKISDIFLKHGEPFFRILETEKIKKICKNDKNYIISTGGGAFEDKENRTVLQDNGIVIYLKTSPQEIYNRIKSETHRPLLRKDFSVEKIAEIMNKRAKNYEKADIILTTNNKTPVEIAKEIKEKING